MTDVVRPIEVELKYRVVDLAAAERYLVADEIGSFTGSAAARSSQFEDHYVDTADGAIGRAGYAVRIRQTGRGTAVSVKSLARTEGAGGSVRREELEGPADRTVGPLEWPASDARSLVLELAGDAPLVELVTIRQLRRKRIVRDGDTRVELSLDEVDVVVALTGRRPLRRARGRAGQGRRGASDGPGRGLRRRQGTRPGQRQQAGGRARVGPARATSATPGIGQRRGIRRDGQRR